MMDMEAVVGCRCVYSTTHNNRLTPCLPTVQHVMSRDRKYGTETKKALSLVEAHRSKKLDVPPSNAAKDFTFPSMS